MIQAFDNILNISDTSLYMPYAHFLKIYDSNIHYILSIDDNMQAFIYI